jgi:hypothetical protein
MKQKFNDELFIFKEALVKYLNINIWENFFKSVHGEIEKDYKMRWAFWIQKLIQCNMMEECLDIVPT